MLFEIYKQKDIAHELAEESVTSSNTDVAASWNNAIVEASRALSSCEDITRILNEKSKRASNELKTWWTKKIEEVLTIQHGMSNLLADWNE
ncbi:MAG: hypothetical protein ACOYK6_04095 [Chthoniobacterales bacterium]